MAVLRVVTTNRTSDGAEARHCRRGISASAESLENVALAAKATAFHFAAALATLGAMFIHRITQTGLSGRGAWPWRSCPFAHA